MGRSRARRPAFLTGLLALVVAASVALAPGIAAARAGSSFGHSSSSFGSRGSRSFESNGAQSLPSRSTALPGRTAGGSVFARHPFLSGLAGGMLMSWLFGHHGFGLLFELLILGFLIFGVVRLLRGRRLSLASSRGALDGLGRGGMAPAVPYRGRDVAVADADLTVFQRLHNAVQEAWSRADLDALGRLMTPEMLNYFRGELARNTQSGVRNVVSDVRLVHGELTEGWEEGDRRYATAHLRWTALDYVVRLGRQPGAPDFLVSGDPRAPSAAEEVWTFVRPAGSGWVLSAIQQV